MNARYVGRTMTMATRKAFMAELKKISLAANANKASINATLTKLDADAGVTDTTYSSLGAVTTTDVNIT